MHKLAVAPATAALASLAVIAAVVRGPAPEGAAASSHREAPLIADDRGLSGEPNAYTAAGPRTTVVDVAEQAVGGFLVGKKLPLGDGVDANDVQNMGSFPYAADPTSGFDNVKGRQTP